MMRWNFQDGEIVLLTLLKPDQQATVLQLPASTNGSHGRSRAIHKDFPIVPRCLLRGPVGAYDTA